MYQFDDRSEITLPFDLDQFVEEQYQTMECAGE